MLNMVYLTHAIGAFSNARLEFKRPFETRPSPK
jgi:hypothetical protein